MGAFFGCLAVAFIISLAVAYGIEPGLLRVADALERIANALEKDKEDNPGNDDVAT